MKKSMLISIAVMMIGSVAVAQKVANYSYGEPGQASFESFSFWVKKNKRAEIYYNYGADRKEVKPVYVGKGVLNGESCFKVQIKKGYILYISPKANELIVSDLSGKYNKHFTWAYEGPVNGIGTFCTPCAEDETAAMKLVQMYYMK